MLICKSMAFSSVSRLLPYSIRHKNPNFSTALSPAEKYYTHLQKYGDNIEKTLPAVRAKLDSSCVNEVLNRCSLTQSQLGLRFFIWAGVQSYYRHSSYLYSKACELFRINQNPRAIIDVIEAYRVEGTVVSVKTFNVVLHLLREAKLADEALWILKKMAEFNIRADTVAYNSVIRLFCEKGDMDLAAGLMKEMGLIDLYPNMITYVTMIKGFCNVGRLEDACKLFKVMKGHGCSPNVVVYTVILDGVCRFGSLERALELLGEMEKESGDCSPNVVTYTSMIQSCCEKGKLIEALEILDRMRACGCAPNRVTVSILMKGFCAEGRVEEAFKLIDKVVAGGNVSYGECYSSLVASLVGNKNLQEAERLFRRMLANAVKPDGLACGTLIKALCLEGRVLDGFHLFDEFENMEGLSYLDSDIYSILLVGLSQKRHSVEAVKLARLMVDRGIQLKTPYFDSIVEHLKESGDKEIVMYLSRIFFDRQ